MGMLAGWLIRLGVGEKWASFVAHGAVVMLFVGFVLWNRYDAHQNGVAKEKLAWEAAIASMTESSYDSAKAAEETADENEKTEIARVIEEKERIDEAIANDEDVFDVMFGSDVDSLQP